VFIFTVEVVGVFYSFSGFPEIARPVYQLISSSCLIFTQKMAAVIYAKTEQLQHKMG
jgi:hypothetical protein